MDSNCCKFILHVSPDDSDEELLELFQSLKIRCFRIKYIWNMKSKLFFHLRIINQYV